MFCVSEMSKYIQNNVLPETHAVILLTTRGTEVTQHSCKQQLFCFVCPVTTEM